MHGGLDSCPESLPLVVETSLGHMMRQSMQDGGLSLDDVDAKLYGSIAQTFCQFRRGGDVVAPESGNLRYKFLLLFECKTTPKLQCPIPVHARSPSDLLLQLVRPQKTRLITYMIRFDSFCSSVIENARAHVTYSKRSPGP